MNPAGPSEWLWKEGAGYYTETESDLLQRPCLPNERSVRDQRMMRVFRGHAGLTRGSEVLEIGCGRSPWLPYLAKVIGCRVSGIEIEPHASGLARANLAGVGVEGQVYCRDGFDPRQNEDLRGRFDLVYSLGVIEHLDSVSEKLRALAYYLKPGGRVLSAVPNLQGINWVLQRFGSLPVLQAHVVYDTMTLQQVHELAGFKTVASEYAGFFDGFLTSSVGQASKLKLRMHSTTCRLLGLGSVAWSRLGLPIGEWRWTSPFVIYVGVQSQDGRIQ